MSAPLFYVIQSPFDYFLKDVFIFKQNDFQLANNKNKLHIYFTPQGSPLSSDFFSALINKTSNSNASITWSIKN